MMINGPVTSKHGNLYTTLLTLILRVLRSTHAEMNVTEEGKGENGDGNREGGPAGAERGKEGRNGRRAQAGRAVGAGAKKGAHWSGMCKHTGQPTSGTVPIRFGTYNIRNGRNGGLESAL